MKITYIGHSGFSVELDNVILIFDYFKDGGNVIEKLLSTNKKIIVFSSHFHEDHFQRPILDWKSKHESISYILSYDIVKRIRDLNIDSSSVVLRPGNSISLDCGVEVYAFGSTDSGCSYLVKYNGRTIFHAGDLNNWCWKEESTPQEIKKANSDFIKIVKEIDVFCHNIDVVMFPVDARMGKDYFIGAKQFVHELSVRYFLPMHFWQFRKEACDFSLYKNEEFGTYICLTEPGGSIDIL